MEAPSPPRQVAVVVGNRNDRTPHRSLSRPKGWSRSQQTRSFPVEMAFEQVQETIPPQTGSRRSTRCSHPQIRLNTWHKPFLDLPPKKVRAAPEDVSSCTRPSVEHRKLAYPALSNPGRQSINVCSVWDADAACAWVTAVDTQGAAGRFETRLEVKPEILPPGFR